MKAMLLAAGRGERMRPLTDHTPKPLLKAGGTTLIEHRLEALRKAGITECVINLAYRGEQIRAALGDGNKLGLALHYSDEGSRALEAGGGIIHALALLGDEPFVAVNADIWTDFDFTKLPERPPAQAHLVLVDNPDHHPGGDFSLNNGRVSADGKDMLTYSGIGVYRPELFRPHPPGRRALRPILVAAMAAGRVSGQHHSGYWKDVGTPGRLAELEAYLRRRPV